MVADQLVFGAIFLLIGTLVVLFALDLITAVRYILYRLTGSEWIAPADVKYAHTDTIPESKQEVDDGN